MRGPLTIDQVEELELRARTPERRRAAAAKLAAWAQEAHPEDDEEVSPALLLVKAGEALSLADDHGAALELFRRGAVAEGHVAPDVRCYLHHGLLQVGDVEGAREVADAVRRSKPANPDVYVFIGEDYELVGNLAEANRWLNLGLRRVLAQTENQDVDGDAVLLLAARRRVRRALGLPPDEFDDHLLLSPLPE